MDFFKHNSKRSPNSPLVKSPYLRLSVEFKKLSSKIEDIDLINTFAILKLGNQEKKTNIIRHISSPKWFEEFEFQVDNVKENKLLIEIFSTKIYSTTDAKIIGFQLIPIKVLEKQNMVGEKITLILKLILSSTNNFFSEDENNILHINRYDPLKYKVESREANLIHDKKNNNLDCPLIFLTFEYMNYFHLWKCNINIHSIIQRNNNKNQMNYFFRIFIKRNDGLQWFKEVTFEEIEELRNFLVMYVVEVISP